MNIKFNDIFKHFDRSFIGEKYRKYDAISDPNEKNKYKEMYDSGSTALSEFKKLGIYFTKKGYVYRKKLPAWKKQSQEMSNYFWLELKKELYKELPSSISIFANKYGLRIVIEIKSDEAKKIDLERHNRFLKK